MKLPPLDPRDCQDIVRRALDEDLIDAAGLDVAFECFRALEPEAEMTVHRGDGATAKTPPRR